MKVIINADDCGNNEIVNEHIRQAIEAGKITSTTIMANQPAFDGAVELYEKYHQSISFGAHLNISQGIPLLHSKKLVEAGILCEDQGELKFSKAQIMSYRFKRMPIELKTELYNELKAQVNRLLKAGVRLSHFDSHHDTYTAPHMLSVVHQLMQDYGICKIRPMTDFAPDSPFYYGKRMWHFLMRLRCSNLIMPDDVIAFRPYFESEYRRVKGKKSIELVIHPGHYMETYQQEEQMMLNKTYPKEFELINYNEL